MDKRHEPERAVGNRFHKPHRYPVNEIVRHVDTQPVSGEPGKTVTPDLMKILSADHVLPISSPPIENGAVAIDGVMIAAVGTREEISALFPQATHEDFGEAAILPGFVNC